MVDLTGKRFGMLTVDKKAGVTNNKTMWLCKCDCGNTTVVPTAYLNNGHTKSCGCGNSKFHTSHGMSRSHTYTVWHGMMTRVSDNPSSQGYKNYGSRGVTVCERWHKFENFLADMGECPEKMSIDRIDVNGNYEPSNCRWATQKQQMNNTRSNHIITFNGKSMTIQQWSDYIGIPGQTLRTRIKRGWSIEDALTKKVRA